MRSARGLARGGWTAVSSRTTLTASEPSAATATAIADAGTTQRPSRFAPAGRDSPGFTAPVAARPAPARPSPVRATPSRAELLFPSTETGGNGTGRRPGALARDPLGLERRIPESGESRPRASAGDEIDAVAPTSPGATGPVAIGGGGEAAPGVDAGPSGSGKGSALKGSPSRSCERALSPRRRRSRGAGTGSTRRCSAAPSRPRSRRTCSSWTCPT